jgi:hypothetical protein
MAVYIGSKHVTNPTDIAIGNYNPQLYIGGFLTFPENVTYTFQNGTVRYSSGAILNAAGTNYAWYTADVLVYAGGVYVSSAASVTMAVTKVSGSTAFHIEDGTNITADGRGNVTGATRSATYYALYGNNTAGTFTVTQLYNYTTTSSTLTALSVVDDECEPVDTINMSHRGGYVENVYLQLIYDDTLVYTSGYEVYLGTHTEPCDPDNPITPDTYSVPSGTNWMSVNEYGNLYVSANTSTTNSRQATVTCYYSELGVTAHTTFDVYQYDAHVSYEYQYIISSADIDPTNEFEAYDDYVTYNDIQLSAIRRYGYYEDGSYHVTQVTYWNTDNDNVYVELTGPNADRFELFNVYDVSQGSQAVFNWSDNIGHVLITPTQPNLSDDVITATLVVHFFDATRELEVIQQMR